MGKEIKLQKSANLTKSFFWVTFSNFIGKALFFISSIVVARILYPEDFGIMSMAATFSGFIDVFNKLGIEAFVMSRKNLTKPDLDSVYLLNISIRLISAIILISIGPFVASIYKTPEVQYILIFSGISFFVSSFSSIPRAVLLINLKFDVVSKIEMVQNLINVCLIIIMALGGFRYLSFVIPLLITNLVVSIIYLVLTKWKFSNNFNKKTLTEVFVYSKSFLPKTMLSYFVYNSDYIFVGYMLGSKLLGYYFFGFDKAFLVVSVAFTIICRIFFPVLSRAQSDPHELKRVFFDLIEKSAFILYPLIFIQIILANEIITTIYGTRWINSIFIFQLILGYTFGRVIASNIHILFDAVNMPHQNLKHFIVITPICVIALFLGTIFGGLIGVSFAAFLIHSFAAILLFIRVCKVFKWNLYEFILASSKCFIPIILQLPIIIPLKLYLNYFKVPDIITLLIITPLIMILYLIFTRIFLKDIYKNFVLQFWQKISTKINLKLTSDRMPDYEKN